MSWPACRCGHEQGMHYAVPPCACSLCDCQEYEGGRIPAPAELVKRAIVDAAAEELSPGVLIVGPEAARATGERIADRANALLVDAAWIARRGGDL